GYEISQRKRKRHRGSLRVDEDGRDAAPTTTSRVRASGLGVHFGGCDVQLSAHADTDAEVCLKSAQRPELHVSWRNQNKYQTRTDRRISQRAEPCSIEIFQHPARSDVL